MLSDKPVRLRVWGGYACFTRHEFHVERVSYPVITPSAARGILEAILMKPVEKPAGERRADKEGFRWHILKIGIVNKGVMMSLLRNELATLGFGNNVGVDISDDPKKVRAQRHSLILAGGADASGKPRMLEYIIEAALEVPEPLPRHESRKAIDVLAKYQNCFERRAAKGQSYHRPYFGCREFACDFELVDENAQANKDIDDDFGMIFNDFDYSPVWRHWQAGDARPTDWEKDEVRVKPLAAVRAEAVSGWITVNTLEQLKQRKGSENHD